ncbi:g-protein associated signal transduction, partial [Cystoisospora suis]
TGFDHATKAQCAGDAWIRPILGGFPFYLRLCQCIIRYRKSTRALKEAKEKAEKDRGRGEGSPLQKRKNEGLRVSSHSVPTDHVNSVISKEAHQQRMHLLNSGKYIAGMLVIFCNSVPWEAFGVLPYSMCMIWVYSYMLGTLYMFSWDVKVDWSLMPDPDHFVRTGKRLYPLWMYRSIAVGNLIGRLTWAMTLMPPTSFNSDTVGGNLLILVISLIEILRRAAWTLLRLENEHLSNSSKYRAMLWVPPLYQDHSLLFYAGRVS